MLLRNGRFIIKDKLLGKTVGVYLGDLAHHLSADHQSLNKGSRSHKGMRDHCLHLAGDVSEWPQCLDLLGHTLQVVLTCEQHTTSTKHSQRTEDTDIE